ncbi:hypothetical protein BDF20DRAFT_799726, partial [Mycotypha africana]|uniref:uncharacterized protein n=1 Tax=Mycotypha africana TaxID=64632 RepID=UPI0023005E4D
IYSGSLRTDKNALKLLHQIEADLLVKSELVNHFEKSECQYTQMREVYEEKLTELNNHIINLQQQRDCGTQKSAPCLATITTAVRNESHISLELREARSIQDVVLEYKLKLQKLNAENKNLREKNAQTLQNAQTANNKARSTIQQLRTEIETLKLEIKCQGKKLKMQTDKALAHEKEIQQLERRIKTSVDAKKKLVEANEAQKQAYRRRTVEMSAANTYLRHLTNILRKAANEGTFLNEATLTRMLD